VDTLLRGRPLPPELRYWDDGKVKIEAPPDIPSLPQRGGVGYRRQSALPSAPKSEESELPFTPTPPHLPGAPLSTIRVFPYGVAKNRLRQAAKRLRVPALLVDSLGEADVLVTLRSYYRRRQKVISDAENRRTPTYVLRSNTVTQMESFLSDLFNLESTSMDDPSLAEAMEETRNSIQRVLNGARSIDLSPASSYIRRLQHQMARQANLVSHSYGKEPQRRVRIFRQ
jgi:hypothetical protein